MFRIAVMVLGLQIALGSQVVLAADRVPTFDPTISCRSAAAASVMTGRTPENCLQDEHYALEALRKSWPAFSVTDKAHCNALESAGGPPSYVELLSCLEMSRDARAMAKDDELKTRAHNRAPAGTTGASPADRRPITPPTTSGAR